MKQKKHPTEEIIRLLRAADSGKDLEAVCRQHNVSAASFYRWQKKFGGMELQDARKYRQLEKEHGELKQMLAERLLKTRVREEVNARKWGALGRSDERSGGVVKAGLCSQRRAGRYLGIHRSSPRHPPKQPSNWLLRLHQQIGTLSSKYPCLGYQQLTRLLRSEGWQAARDLSPEAWTRGSAIDRKHNRHENNAKQVRPEI